MHRVDRAAQVLGDVEDEVGSGGAVPAVAGVWCDGEQDAFVGVGVDVDAVVVVGSGRVGL